MFNQVGIPVDVVRSDIGMKDQIGFPEAVIARYEAGLFSAGNGQLPAARTRCEEAVACATVHES